MSNMLRSPSIGPIVGHTTTNSVRIWMRGSDGAPGRTVGVAALYNADGNYLAESVRYLRLCREYDRTGVVDFTELNPETSYIVRLGSLTLDSTDAMATVEDDELFSKLPKPEALRDDLEKLPPEESMARFTTYPVSADNGLSFIFGSCRYPGLLWTAKKTDRIFGAILEKFRSSNAPRFLMMVGDQIYADKLNKLIPIERADTPSEFHERYVTAFTSPNMRALLRTVPTYMILDDHEIEDNWVKGRMDRDAEKRLLFQTAISAYMSYQWIHCPRNYGPRGEVSGADGDKLFYSFECSGYPFFVMDSRTQRIRDDHDYNLDDNHLLGYPSKPSAPGYQGQVNILCDWLVSQQQKFGDRPKFIVSPSVFVPNGIETAGGDEDERARRKKCEDDSWAAFPATRRQLLQAIVNGSIQNVVFLCGDVHCSCIAEISFTHKTIGPLPVRAFCITSSALYWPWAFADGDPLSFVHDSIQENDDFVVNDNVVMNYKAYGFEQDDNFTRIDVIHDEIIVQNYDRDGKALGNKTKVALAAFEDAQ